MSAITKEEFFRTYKVRHKIGEGGYGSVFKIQDENSRYYALKTIVCYSTDQLNSSYQEILMVCSVRHEALIGVHAFLNDRKVGQGPNGQRYEFYILGIVMDYAESSLYDDIAQRRTQSRLYPKETVVKLLLTMVDLLEIFQRANIAHRDLKPENILMMGSGFKLTDFGLAKWMPKNRRTSSYAGSPFYVAPKLREALDRGDFQGLDHDVYKSDVFSLGLNVLEAASLGDVRALNYPKNARKIEELLQRMMDSHDPWFIRVLRAMLLIDEEQRPDFIGLKELIQEERNRENFGRFSELQTPKKNPFIEPYREENTKHKNIYDYIKTTEEKPAIEPAKKPISNLYVQKLCPSSCKALPLSRSEDLFEEAVRTTEKKKRSRFEPEESKTPTHKTEPFLVQEIKLGQGKFKDLIIGPASLITVAKSTDFEDQRLLLTAGEECIEIFRIDPENLSKPMHSLQKYRCPKRNFLSMAVLSFVSEDRKQRSEVKFAVLGTCCGRLAFVKLSTGKGLGEEPGYNTGLQGKAVTALGTMEIKEENKAVLLAGSSDFIVRVFSFTLDNKNSKISMPNLLMELIGHSSNISVIGGIKMGEKTLIMSSGTDSTVIFWDMESRKREKTVNLGCDWISAMKVWGSSVNKERALCFLGSGNAGIHVLEANGTKDKTWDHVNEAIKGWVSFIDFYEDFDILLVCEGKGRVLLIEEKTRRKIVNFEESESDISGGFIFGSDRRDFLLVVTYFDGRVRCVSLNEAFSP